jgi:tetratricopeptide (TPR) repeat protein
VYASRPLSLAATQHSLPSGGYSLLGPDFHRLDRASLAAGALIRSPRRRIVDRLAAVDQSNRQWQRDLAIAHGSIGDVLTALGRFKEALQAYRDNLAIFENLAAADRSKPMAVRPSNVYNKVGKFVATAG